MKVLILLCFAVLACHQAAAVSKAEVLNLLQTNYAIDDVLDLFKGLRSHEANEISDLDEEATEVDGRLADEISNANNLLDQKVASCNAIDNTVQQGQDQAKTLQDNIQAAQDTLDANKQKAEGAADARCASNLLFISELGDREEAVEFLQYLRGRVADPSFAEYLNQQQGAFVQIKTALSTKQENEILSLIAKHHMLSMMQVKQSDYEGESQSELDAELNAQVRTSDQVGTDYQDNSRGALQVQGITDDSLTADQYVDQILGYIDALIANLQGDVQKLQDVETSAVQAFIDYRRQLRDQNAVLAQYIEASSAALTNLQAVNANNQEAAAQCRLEVTPLEDGLKAAQDNKASYDSATAQRRQNLVETVALLDQVIQVYNDEVVNVATNDQKARADDYLDNQQFDGTPDFAARADIPQLASN